MSQAPLSSPTVTVIIATYNSSATLRLTLASLLNQDFTDFEGWVIGDGCTDDSQAVVHSLGDERLHWKNLDKNYGSQTYPNNEGLRLARGQYIAYLGHDDLWMPHHLSGLVQFIQDRRIDFTYALTALIGPEGVRACIGPPRPGVTYAWPVVPPSSWLHRRDVIESCGLWKDPAQLAMGIDLEYLRRAFLAGKLIDLCPQLSVLKFPAWWFSLYAHVGEPPQLKYWQQLKENPRALEHQILLRLSIELARERYGGDEPLSVILRKALAVVFHKIRQVNAEREPFVSLLRWRFRRMRRHYRRQKGLPPHPSL